MRTFINTCGIVCFVGVLLYFSMHNTAVVTVRFSPTAAASYPLWAIIVVPFFCGVLAGNLLDVLQRFRLRKRLRQLQRQAPPAGSPRP